MALWVHSSSIEILREEENTPWEVKYLLLEIIEKKKMFILSVSITNQWNMFMSDNYSK